MVYSVYRARNDVFVSLRQYIPESVPVIGLIAAADDIESSLWRPFGARRVVDVLQGDRSQELKLHWLVVKNCVIGQGRPEDFDQWLTRDGGVLVVQQSVIEKAGQGPEMWSVVRFPGALE